MIRPILKYYDIGVGVKAFSSTRKGGYSHGNYGEFNVNKYCGDDEACITKNRRALCDELDINEERLIMPHQNHGTEIRQIAPDFFNLPNVIQKQILEDVDGVMTNMMDVCVAVSTADCIPVLLYDNEHHACAAVHAGWRGTVARILQRAVAVMKTAYKTNLEHLEVCIGPGISLNAFEVGDEVWQKFAEAGFDMKSISKRYDKWHIDLWECNRMQLIDIGVNPCNIQIANICTYSNTDEFFSARQMSINSGRILTGILLK